MRLRCCQKHSHSVCRQLFGHRPGLSLSQKRRCSSVVLALSITNEPPWKLDDFDQSFYITIAYDLDHYGVFSNGVFDEVGSPAAAATAPPAGMFFGPVYPLLVLVAMTVIRPRGSH